MVVNTNTFISDYVLFIREFLESNITDPLSGNRGGEQFVLTSYPKRAVRYPIITVKCTDFNDTGNLGMQSEMRYIHLPMEIRVWARNVKEKDTISQEVINDLRTNQFPAETTDTSTNVNLHDFKVLYMKDIDETGDNTPKSKIIGVRYSFILGG